MKRLILLFALCLGACAHRTPVTVVAPDGITHGDGFSFKKLDDGNYGVASQDLTRLTAALDKIGCGKRYFCQVKTDNLEYSVVTVHEKK
jgi:hypothetical protein